MKKSLYRAVICVSALVISANALAATSAKDILHASGVQGGLVVFIGIPDPGLLTCARSSDPYLVHALDTDRDKVDSARKYIQTAGSYGRASADTFDGKRLPYVDNLVNLIVISELESQASAAEIARVLAPRGVVLARGELRNDLLKSETAPEGLEGWRKLVKPVPAEIDDWTHFLHGPDNNALAQDTRVGPPRHMQWRSAPVWGRDHHAEKGTYPSVRSVLSSQGRLICIIDETETSNMQIPSKWFVVARDAFSGLLLWKKRIQATIFDRRLEEVWRRLVVDGDEIYTLSGAGMPLHALDAATGETLRQYDGTEDFQELIKIENTLLVVNKANTLLAFAADTGLALWQWRPGDDGAIVPVTLAAADGQVFVKTEKSVICLSADKGRPLWRRELAQSEIRSKLTWPRERLIVSDGVVLVSFGGKDPKSLNKDAPEFLGSHPRVREYGGRLAALSAKDGVKLWETAYMPNLESAPGEIYVTDGEVWSGPEFAEALDLHTGDVKRTRKIIESLWTDGHHHRCYPGKATSRYIITAKRGMEFIDLHGENHSRNNWARGTCRIGVTPSNGLIYAPPHSCGCYFEAKLFGFHALASERQDLGAPELDNEKRLEKGAAYKDSATLDDYKPRPDDWPTYRGNNARSGSNKSVISSDLSEAWKVDIGGRLTGVTVAAGKVFLSRPDAHALYALDADSGKILWRFTAGARIDTPPTFHSGLLLFGAADGFVYCLRASDGELVWRFLAAPRRMNAMSFEQLESLWPVHGAVLVKDGVAYAAAGRSSHLDGGIMLVGLDPASGEALYEKRLESERVGAIEPPADADTMALKIQQNWTDYKTFQAADRSDSFSMRGALTDIMSSEKGSIFMRHMRFDDNLVEREEKSQHLFSTTSFLDDYEHNRSYWILGSGDFARTPVAFPWIVKKSLSVPYGVMLVFDEKSVCGVRRAGYENGPNGSTSRYTLFSMPRPDPSHADSGLPDFQKRSSGVKPSAGGWSVPLGLRPRAMLRAADTLAIGGTVGDKGVVHIASALDGKTLADYPLVCAPVWDGMACASASLFLALEDGTVLRLSANVRGEGKTP